MDNIKVKKVTSGEITQLQIIGRQTFSETFSDVNTAENMEEYLSESFSSERLSSEINNSFSEFYFATLEDRVIGYLKVNRGEAQTELKEQNSLELERIYVLKEFIGKKVGQVLYNKALELGKELNVDFIWLGVWEENPRAIGFYKRNGFREFDRHIFKLGDDLQTDIMMKLELPGTNPE